MVKPLSKYFIIILLILLLVELIFQVKSRQFDGVIMQDNEDYEYIAVAHQHIARKGRNISYNSLSMRSAEPDTAKLKVLAFGDSIINGGEAVDDDSLATSLLNTAFNDRYQFLNISAGSWGPDNCFAYLKKHGHFDAKHIILFVSSHDAYDNMSLDGHAKFGSGKQYPSALFTYLHRHLFSKLNAETQKTTVVDSQQFNSGFEDFYSYCKNIGIPLTIYLHPELSELHQNQYNSKGQEITQFCKERNIRLIQALSYSITEDCYLDHIHLNTKGQRKIADIIKEALKDRL